MSWWEWVLVPLAVLLAVLLAASVVLSAFYEARDRIRDRKAHKPFPVFGSHERDPDLADGWRAAEVDMLRRWMRLPTVDEPIVAVIGEHSPDCACEACWEDRMAEMVAAFDWSAAELDFGRRP